MHKIFIQLFIIFIMVFGSCKDGVYKKDTENQPVSHLSTYSNIINFMGSPKSAKDKSMLMYADQGAWFAYSLPDTTAFPIGFSGPFLMTQENGTWSSSMLTQLHITVNEQDITWHTKQSNSYSSHLQQIITAKNIQVEQNLVFSSGNTVLIRTVLTNQSNQPLHISLQWKNQPLLASGLTCTSGNNEVIIKSSKSSATGHLIFPKNITVTSTDSLYATDIHPITLAPNESKEIIISQSFIFETYSWEKEKKAILNTDFESVLNARKTEKEWQLAALLKNKKNLFQEEKYGVVLAKAHLTLQNNWRIAAGELKHAGLFPSYHYQWFHGFWSWDSWKHAVGLSYYDTALAKDQIRAMFDFQRDDGFIADCVFRDTLIEKPNYRDTKPPLSAWAVAKVYEKDKDTAFVNEFYPKLKKYHQWWYDQRDHDQDGLCEYGSTDGSLVAAKWESGMDNAIRFDGAKILKNLEGAYSLDQESVDLNAYLYAEKLYLSKLATVLDKSEEAAAYLTASETLKTKIQTQFYDPEDGWFYDTNLEGNAYLKGQGSEGWTALWAHAATQEQATAIKNNMMDPQKFFTKVPFQTMSADHVKFNPMNGYWRGPNWLDQAYFGVEGLRNYGFYKEADRASIQILEGAEGLLEKGKSIRENYHPLSGKGLNAQNFSWSAAHLIMLLTKEK